VGNSLTTNQADLKTNFISDQLATDFAKLYATDNLTGVHLITLGPVNEATALEAVKSFPKWIASVCK
jgi:phosphoribosylformimino-5-aminoimidazole carboxamide ribotide isomerase